MPSYLPPIKLIPRDPDDDSRLGGEVGQSVVVSGDGRTAVVGAPKTSFVAVFVRTGGTWTQQAILTPTGVLGDGGTVGDTDPLFGTDVAVSHDGDTILVGGPGDEATGSGHTLLTGSAWIFVRAAGVWSQQGSKLKPSIGSGGSRFAGSVALSADGNTALIGDLAAHRTVQAWVIHTPSPLYSLDEGTAYDAGVAYVFVREDGAWTLQETLFPPHVGDEGPFLDAEPPVDDFTVEGAAFGKEVSLSADGNIAVCTAPNNFHAVDPTTLVPGSVLESEAGSIYTFFRSGGAWAIASNRVELTGFFTSNPPFSYTFAYEVRISPGGTQLAVQGFKTTYPITSEILLDTWLYDVDPDSGVVGGPLYLLLGSSSFQQFLSYAWSADGSVFAAGVPSLSLISGTLVQLLVDSTVVGVPFPDDDTTSLGTSVDVSDDAKILIAGGPLIDDIDGNAGAAWIYRARGLAVSFDGIEYAG